MLGVCRRNEDPSTRSELADFGGVFKAEEEPSVKTDYR